MQLALRPHVLPRSCSARDSSNAVAVTASSIQLKAGSQRLLTGCAATSRQATVRSARRKVVVQAGGAPKTGQHQAEESLKQEALAAFFEAPCTTTPTTGGVNNVVNYVQTADGKRYILRIYNNGKKSEKVRVEHEILRQLGQQTLSFAVPRPLPARDGSGATHVLLSSGDEACVFDIIPGDLAKTTSPREVGRATGELCSAMSRVDVGRDLPIPPYYDVFNVHHAIKGDKQRFYQEVATNPAFEPCRADIDYLVEQIRELEPRLEAYEGAGLPMQPIHGDLHYDNVMVVPGPSGSGDERVSGLLDFEFCAYDLRAMELAVALSKYVGEEEPMPLINEFVSGYAEHGQLNDEEMSNLPDFINLRIFSNVIYFTGRALAGEDSIESLTSRAGSYAKRVQWVNANREAIVESVKQMMAVPVAA